MAMNKDKVTGVAIPMSIWGQPVVSGCHCKTTKDETPQILPPIDLSHHFSYATSKRVESSVKHFYKYFYIPGIGNLAAGLPHVSYFPYDTLEATVAPPQRFEPTPDGFLEGVFPSTGPLSERLLVPKQSDASDIVKRIDLATALQYGTAAGYPPLHSFIRQFVRENLHPNVPYAGGPEITLTCGSTDGFSKAVEAFTNVWNEERNWIGEREGILCEEFAYMNAIQTVKPRGINVVPVVMDADGMMATGEGGLANVLENWDFSRGKRPHLMYTVTIGHNPSGAVMPLERRREIYALCQKYDIVIIEDDPYWHLQYPSAIQLLARYRGRQAGPDVRNYNWQGKSSGFAFLDSLVPSFLSVDTEGRVVRLDTFSKTIAPGCRLGWVTAQPRIVEQILRITETTTQQPSGFVQSMVAELIMGGQRSDCDGKVSGQGASGWKVDGWVRWLEGLRGEYERRMQNMCTILEEGKFVIVDRSGEQQRKVRARNQHSESIDEWEIVNKVQMYDFHFPRGGMFVWVKLCLETHPLWSQVDAVKLAAALWKRLTKKPYLCLTAPGQLFAPTQEKVEKASSYFRLCFAPVEIDDMSRITHSFVAGCKNFWHITDANDVDGDEEFRLPS